MIKSCTLRMIVTVCLMLGFVWAVNGQGQQNEPSNISSQSQRQAGFMPLSEAQSQYPRLMATTALTEVKPTFVIKGEHVATGIGLRNRGGGTINLRGIPSNSTINRALIYWCVLSNSPSQNPTVSVNGDSINGTLVGSGTGPCWGVSNNYVYRAEVPTYLLYIGGNGDYQISGVPSTEGEGISPWAPVSGQNLAEGATLVIFYTRNSGTSSTTYVYDSKSISGTMFFSQFNANLTGFNANKSTATFTSIGADGQVGNDITSNFDVSRELSFFQGTQISGYSSTPNAYLDADSDWNGNDGVPLNQLWDTASHTVPIKQGSTSANVRYQAYGDCLVICAFILTI